MNVTRKVNARRGAAARALLLVVAAAISLGGASARPALQTVAQVRALTVAEAAERLPVRLVATVTYYDPDDHILFVQDQTAGIFVNTERVQGLDVGARVEVQGVTKADFTTIIDQAVLRKLGSTPLPTPKQASFYAIAHGYEDCNLVALTGTVRSASFFRAPAGQVMFLTLVTRDGNINAHLLRSGPLTPEQLIDSEIKVSAVAGAYFNDRLQFNGPLLRISSYRDVTFIKPAPKNPFDSPTTPIGRLMRFRAENEMDRRVRVVGTVTLFEAGHYLVIQDQGVALLINTIQQGKVKIGDLVEAVGSPTVGAFGPDLEAAQFRVMRAGPDIRPVHINANPLALGSLGYVLVSADGRILHIDQGSSDTTLDVQSGPYMFRASYTQSGEPDRRAGVTVGSTVRLTGICVIQPGGVWLEPVGFRLILRSPADIQVLSTPSWWSVQHLVLLLSATAGILLWICGWVYILKKRDEKQKAQIRRATALQNDRSHVLELVNRYESLDKVVAALGRLIEHQWPGADSRIDLSPRDGQDCPHIAAQESPSRWSRRIISAADEYLGTIAVNPPKKSAQDNPDGVLDVVGNVIALAVAHRELYQRLSYRSQYDALTGLPNRATLEARLDSALAEAREYRTKFAVLFVDLDGFKRINDEYGHKIGDVCLQRVAASLQAAVRKTDVVARWGGDEFIVIARDLGVPSQTKQIAEKILAAVQATVCPNGPRLVLSSSIGIAMFPDDDETAEGLTQKADHAMYLAKARGKNQFQEFSQPLSVIPV